MTIEKRIKRRKRGESERSLVEDGRALSPVCHVGEPTACDPELEALLEHLDPVFDHELPPNAYVWGPTGAGKSAVVTALFARLKRQLGGSGSIIHTTTRAQSQEGAPAFVYVDARTAPTSASLCNAVLEALVDGSVPDGGLEAGSLLGRIQERLAASGRRVVLAVDHVGEPETYTLSTLSGLFGPVGSQLSWLAIGRQEPGTVEGTGTLERLRIPAYRRGTLTDILESRAREGLAQGGVRVEQLRTIATWAETNAHDALAALCGAAGLAAGRNHSRIRDGDLVDAFMDIPQPCVSLARVLGLPASRKRVLGALVSTGESQGTSVASAAERIAGTGEVDLSVATVERFLYELAEAGIVERVPVQGESGGVGRSPSRVTPRFSPTVFQQLADPPGSFW